MKILVTGSDGFIGKHLVWRLVGLRYDVVGLDVKSGNDILTCDLPDADLVFHLAAQTDATSADIEADARVNIMGLLRVLTRYGDKVVFASSTATYDAKTPYAISKLTGEHYCELYGASVVRLCNVFGDGGHSVIERFAQDETLTIYGDGQQVRTYSPVESAVDLFVDELFERQQLRLLHGEDCSVLEIAARHPEKELVFKPARKFDPPFVIQLRRAA